MLITAGIQLCGSGIEIMGISFDGQGCAVFDQRFPESDPFGKWRPKII
jgi:hypothetical protein